MEKVGIAIFMRCVEKCLKDVLSEKRTTIGLEYKSERAKRVKRRFLEKRYDKKW